MYLALAVNLAPSTSALAQPVPPQQAARAAVHPVADAAQMNTWLARVPVTRDWPPDFAETLQGQGQLLVVEMSTAPDCLPCADLWARLRVLARRYGWRLRAINESEAMTRSGRLGLPWVGHPVAWVRPIADQRRTIPVAIGTDHAPNLARNLYLAAKMLTGVKPAVGVRGMAKFTGIVGASRERPTGGR
ncbi:hypothetical protein KRR38_01495 [Novosphingobium sp. G106]|nr:hypothetical protein [Novosphingobium sp. G106]